MSEQTIEYWAVRHLDRYASSVENLRRVLAGRIGRIERAQDEAFPESPQWIDRVVARLIERGYVDDRRYAREVAARMRARGASAQRIRQHLEARGVPREISRDVSSDHDDEFEAALRYARRRRLGPFRPDVERRAQSRERDLAALGRSGYSYEIARRVIDLAPGD